MKQVQRSSLMISPAERADVIVDFSDVPEGSRLYLTNEGAGRAVRRGQARDRF